MKCALCGSLLTLDNRCPRVCFMGRVRKREIVRDAVAFLAGASFVLVVVAAMTAMAAGYGA